MVTLSSSGDARGALDGDLGSNSGSASDRHEDSTDGPKRLSLRAEQREHTRERIVSALVELIEGDHPLEVSMAAVAERAGVSEPTLYRHFPTKRALFAALASQQFRTVTDGVAPTDLDELVDAVATVFSRAAAMQATVRWILAAPDPVRVPRVNTRARLDMLRLPLAAGIEDLSDSDAEHLLRGVLLLTSPMAWLYWSDYLGLDAAAAAETATWMIQQLVARDR